MLKTMQIGLNTSDLAGSLRFYSEVFGFINAGGQGLWGEAMRVQALGPDSRALMWWMLGRQSQFQLELFHHSVPAPRPLPPDWRPCDLGWVRFGVRVVDFDRSLEHLAAYRVALLGDIRKVEGLRRAAFRDPFVGTVIEVMEDTPEGRTSGVPAVAYAASSVSDLQAARMHYRDVLGLALLPAETLHQPADEALWGLAGARRDIFLADAGALTLEIVQYHEPLGRSRAADYRCSDQGFVNVALGSRDREEVLATFERLRASGLVSPHVISNGPVVAGYIIDPERELELLSAPEELNAALGFVAAAPFFSEG